MARIEFGYPLPEYEPEPTYAEAVEIGQAAGLRGAECWENPFVHGKDKPDMTLCWHAGWCRGRQERAKNAPIGS